MQAIVTEPTVERVIPALSVEQIVFVTAVENIVGRSADERVVPAFAAKRDGTREAAGVDRVVAASSGQLRQLDLREAVNSQTGEQVLQQGAHNDWVIDTAFGLDGSNLVSVGRDMTAKLTEVKTGEFIETITSMNSGTLRGGIHSVVRHPLHDEILYGDADGVPRIYRMHPNTNRQTGDDANQLWELPALPGRIFAGAFASTSHLPASMMQMG